MTASPGQSLDSSFLDLGGGISRGAVLGRSDGAGGYQATALPFDFIDISSTGTAVLQGSDDGSVWLSPSDLNGFQFTLFGSTSDNLYVSANGYLYLPTGSGYVYAMARDLYVFSPPGSVYWQVFGTGDQQTLVVQWDNVGFCCYHGYDPITFEAVLSEADGSVRFNYLDLQTDISSANEGLNSTVGVQGYSPSGNYNSLFLPTFDAPNEFVGTGRSTQIASLPPRPITTRSTSTRARARPSAWRRSRASTGWSCSSRTARATSWHRVPAERRASMPRSATSWPRPRARTTR